MSDKSAVSTTDAPPPMPVFSQGVRKGNILQVSGQGSVDPATGDFVFAGDVKGQTTRVLQNIEAILKAGGASIDDVVMLRVYLTQREDFAAMNEAYADFVSTRTPSGVLPSRTTVFTGLPLPDMLVEIDALAVLS
ncbi:MAG: RidA family protein [Kribbellaceae bacterium]|jgi:reactive intermediate/imine deaminase|uniref:Reactive intermediate/imine deaminase n=1 Tax=Kribbella shirazensis TaxID=1105143 RepID=A0A7X5V8Z6_9ACTN|nr:RidA family protein [Kribbella shirazensis]NIK56446.1 reactive intermediate/imine deaminase [Kribbella shirazensis]NUR96021.1 RidA family protein [Kribbellaceae bacterium]